MMPETWKMEITVPIQMMGEREKSPPESDKEISWHAEKVEGSVVH